MNKLKELVVELTKLVITAREYFTDEAPQGEALFTAKKTRSKKSAPKTDILDNGNPETTALPEMSEAESSKEALEVCKTFVQKFQKSTPSGYDQAKEILKKQFKVGKIGDLVHTQRLQFMTELRGRLENTNV